MKNILYITYYTEEYLRWARLLEMSLLYHGLPIKAYYKPTTGEWHQNVLRKPQIIVDAMLENPDYDAICWIDADSIVVERPSLLYEVKCDVAFPVFLPGRKTYREPMAGVMMFDNTPKMVDFMRGVAKRIKKYIVPTRLDQKAMREAIAANPGVDVAVLPRTYICVTENPLPARTQQQALAAQIGEKRNLDVAVLPPSYVDLDEGKIGLRPIIVSRRLGKFGRPTADVYQIALDEHKRRMNGTFQVVRKSVSDFIPKLFEAGIETTIGDPNA